MNANPDHRSKLGRHRAEPRSLRGFRRWHQPQLSRPEARRSSPPTSARQTRRSGNRRTQPAPPRGSPPHPSTPHTGHKCSCNQERARSASWFMPSAPRPPNHLQRSMGPLYSVSKPLTRTSGTTCPPGQLSPWWCTSEMPFVTAFDARPVTSSRTTRSSWCMTSTYGVFLDLDVGTGDHHDRGPGPDRKEPARCTPAHLRTQVAGRVRQTRRTRPPVGRGRGFNFAVKLSTVEVVHMTAQVGTRRSGRFRRRWIAGGDRTG